jgi:hypothetical protein
MEGEISFEELKKFVAEARKNTYAGEGESVKSPFLDGSHQFEYGKDKYFYRDIFFAGEKNFIGQEVIYLNHNPIWSMVYSGSAEPEEITPFLKKSLSVLSEKCRLGERCELKENNLLYKDDGQGTLERFGGQEQIFKQGKEVYKLNYHGGLISK